MQFHFNEANQEGKANVRKKELNAELKFHSDGA